MLVTIADLAGESDVNVDVAAAVEAFGAIDGFFNNAGIEGTQNLTEDFGPLSSPQRCRST